MNKNKYPISVVLLLFCSTILSAQQLYLGTGAVQSWTPGLYKPTPEYLEDRPIYTYNVSIGAEWQQKDSLALHRLYFNYARVGGKSLEVAFNRPTMCHTPPFEPQWVESGFLFTNFGLAYQYERILWNAIHFNVGLQMDYSRRHWTVDNLYRYDRVLYDRSRYFTSEEQLEPLRKVHFSSLLGLSYALGKNFKCGLLYQRSIQSFVRKDTIEAGKPHLNIISLNLFIYFNQIKS